MANYHMIGADGKEYGPISVDQLRDWISQGRVNGQTRIRPAESTDWAPAAQVPDLAALFGSAGPPPLPTGAPPVLRPPKPPARREGLAVISFVLGIASFVLCLSAISGIPAIICGYIARSRARRAPTQYGGAGFAMAGIVLGYVSILFSLVVAALLLPAISKAHRSAQWQPRWQPQTQPQPSTCENHLRQIALAFKVWALEHNDQFPFNVSTNAGGTLELCKPGPDGFDQNALVHFRAVGGDLLNPEFLVCPSDHSKHVAPSLDALGPANISYQLRTGTNINGDNPQEVLAVCPIHGNRVFCDGNVRKAPR